MPKKTEHYHGDDDDINNKYNITIAKNNKEDDE